MEERKGYVSHIVFRNAENGYTVFELETTEGEEETCVGNFPFINEGEYICVRGEMVTHPVYMEQLKIESYEVQDPDDKIAMLRYLASGAIAGIRGGLAKRIVDKFGDKTFEIIENEPERLAEVKGISEKKARGISEQFEEKREMRSAMIFLQQYGISNQLAVKIYKEYGTELYGIVKENPYQLAEDISGVGFKIADDIARKSGFSMNSAERIRAGIYYVLNMGTQEGYVYMPEKMLLQEAVYRLDIEWEQILDVLERMEVEKAVIAEETEEGKNIYLPTLYYAEMNCARMLFDLNIPMRGKLKAQEETIRRLEQSENLELDAGQRTAIMEAMNSGLLIITGGPGTGKTTTINMIIKSLREEGLNILLAAPTGRAAKRMSEAAGYEAQTIHRLLEYNGSLLENENQEEKNQSGLFGRNEWNPLETDVLIIDEMSMVDIYLFHSLLKAVAVGTRLILVGDVNQLPSVGPGNVLKDIIQSHCFNVVKLSHIFRQAAESDIIVNAHRINDGEEITLDNQSKDFFCLKRDDSHGVLEVMLWLVRDKMPKYTNCTPFDVQVLTPMKKGELGVHRCNEVLQKYLNPESPRKNQIESHGTLFREGDKVMQMKNNYQIKWEIRGYQNMVIEEGAGVFNGDCGIVTEINNLDKEMTVCFDDEKYVTYAQGNLEELELAYAITIHKSQGSEYPAVVLPLLAGPKPLMNRNILYTAVTRGKQCVTIVGSRETVKNMIRSKPEQLRYSSLDKQIREIEKKEMQKL
ncbi:MAG: ATP-dependent RecD-like DNA helicase [Lachnospiraceae bacterium]|nr:ATP-dependent RecD-like DNA helicase [Lachnospiraceae bacterium]